MLPYSLHEESILINLDAPNREAALAEVIAKLPSFAVPPRKKSLVLDLVLQREMFGTTAVGDSVALPHCFVMDLDHPVSVLAVSRKGIQFSALDGQPVHLIFLTVFPESYRGSAEKQNLLKDAETIFRDRFLQERLKISESTEEAYEIFLREAEHLTGHLERGLRTSA